VVEAPEDTKFSVVMAAGEENTMFVELKNFVESEEFTFFTDYRLGRAKVVASLTSKGTQYRLGDDDKEFVFEAIETHLSLERIKFAMSRHELKVEETTLELTFKAITAVKMYFEFSAYLKSLYRLKMDDLEVANLREGEEVWYEFIPERDYSIKFYRAKGFPLFKVIECIESNYIECLDRNRKLLQLQVAQKKKLSEKLKANAGEAVETGEGTENEVASQLDLFVDKNQEEIREKCEKCIVFIWVHGFTADVQLSINIRSSLSEIELKEMVVVNDRINRKQEYRKYLANVQVDKNAQVTFRVIEGDCQVEIRDSYYMLFNETFSSTGKDYKDITLDALQLPSDKEESSETDNEAVMPNFPPIYKLSRLGSKHELLLRTLHVKVVSLTDKPIDYLLTYSTGGSGVFLEDGVVLKKELTPEIVHTFYYHNQQKESHAYLALSSSPHAGYDAEYSRNEYEVKFFYYPNAADRERREEFKPEMPPKKNENHLGSTVTHVYELPGKYELYEVELETSSYLDITASINHKEMIYLPLGYEYLIKLYPRDVIYLVVDRPATDYLEMTFKKCDSSVPTIYYTNDAREFQKGLYETAEEI
jgi:DNA-binding transcriptional MerR regulator